MQRFLLPVLAFVLTAFAADAQQVSGNIYHDGWIDFNKNGRKDVYEDPSAPVDKRIKNLLSQMNLDEKLCQMTTLYGSGRVLKDVKPTENWVNEIWVNGIANIDEQYNGYYKLGFEYSYPYDRKVKGTQDIQRWFVEKTRLGIPVDFSGEGISGVCQTKATFFPAEVAQGASWDKDLVSAIGDAEGAEAEVLGYTNIYSPVMDIAQDPRWGRVLECYGEDPYLVTQLGRQMIAGLQNHHVVSTVKHFAVYSVPIGGRDGETRVDPKVPYREMRNLYLEPFRVAFSECGAMGTMSSYNDYDGDPVSGSKYFLTDILRKEYGFKGYVVSDSRVVQFMNEKHHVTKDYDDGAALCVNAGLNVCTQFKPPIVYVTALRNSVKSGKISMKTIDERVSDVLRVKFWLGLFDNPYRGDAEKALTLVHCDKHKAVAHRAALESIVLLKNEGGLLPLDKNISSIAVIGPNADEKKELLQDRYGPVNPDFTTLYQGIKAAVPNAKVTYAKGCDVMDPHFPDSELMYFPYSDEERRLFDEALAVARDAQVVVLALGGNNLTIGEAKSRTSLDLPGRQNDLLKAVQELGKPVVLVLYGGRAATINYAAANTPAILHGWFSGEYSGQAMAEVLFGDYNPAGRLPVTFPKSVGQIPMTYLLKPGADSKNTKHTRVNGILYPFGHGLSYTSFEYSNLVITPENQKLGSEVKVSVDVKNTGKMAGDEVVQLYIHDVLSSVTAYKKLLKGFERIKLQPGETKTVNFTLTQRDMGMYNLDNKFAVEPGEFEVMVGASSEDIRLDGKFNIF